MRTWVREDGDALYVLDAPLDVRTEAQIERGLRRLLAGRTALVIAHRLSTIRGAGRILVLDRDDAKADPTCCRTMTPSDSTVISS